MRAGNEDWENNLWSYVNTGDGKSCPGFDSCQSLQDHPDCFNSDKQRVKNRIIRLSLDSENIELSSAGNIPRLAKCPHRDMITSLVRRLAQKYRAERWNGVLPVPDNLITTSPNGLPIEIRRITLKANHGAVWRMDDGWLVHLNRATSPARQRFTLYHEIFHILAHSNGEIAFKKSEDDEVYFNEYLADHFASAMLIPRDILQVEWSEKKDIMKLARLFNVPVPIMFGKLRAQGLI
jgi:Zn-dependent peptidase ImmA (M78 family)